MALSWDDRCTTTEFVDGGKRERRCVKSGDEHERHLFATIVTLGDVVPHKAEEA